MPKYAIVESKVWRHKATGSRVSIYGAVPWLSPDRRDDWELYAQGFSVQNRYSGTVGIGRVPWATREEAEAWVANQEDEHGACDQS